MSTAAAASAVASGMASSPRFRTWPITAVKSLEPMLQKMGLKVSADAIDGTSRSEGSAGRHFSDALVSVGAAGRGGTGSFVSSSGLILTNWHVAYDAVRQASLQGSHDYVRDGFVAKSLKEELKGPNYEVWITKSWKDVSKEVTDVIGSEQDPLKRANRVRDVMQEIAQAAQEDKSSGEADGGKRCDVQEMLPNESYVLFTYERIKDVRIVYVPPKSLGNFGGDTDNFEWPRHTADFTLLRAYVGPDGKAAEYSVDNVPYKPKTFLKVQQQGAEKGDFIFLLGFPGSTMRYAPTSRLRFSDEVAVPNMVSDFARKLQLIAQYEKDSEEAALKLGTSKKGLANEYKRSQGKLVMMRKLGLMQERAQEETALCAKAPEAQDALDRLSKIYDELRAMESVSTALEACRGIYCGSALLAVGHALHEYLSIECPKPDGERESSYRQRNLPFLAQRLAKRLGEIHQPHEAALIKDALATLEKTPDLKAAFAEIVASFGGESYLSKMESAIESTELKALSDPEMMKSIFAEDGAAKDRKATLLQDPFVKCAGSLWEAYAGNRDRSKALLSERDALFAKLLELQRKHSDGEVMYPDCNGSLRLSAGFVEGYEAADAVLCKPQTTLAGLFDKAVEAKLSKDEGRLAEFGCPDRLYDMLSSPSSNCKKVPVCLLYSTDTVGGNSGSPVMNANGELVGINFDRQRQGLMNEFKWSKDYSRSMGVDVRYMLWLMGDYDGAKNLVQEMLAG